MHPTLCQQVHCRLSAVPPRLDIKNTSGCQPTARPSCAGPVFMLRGLAAGLSTAFRRGLIAGLRKTFLPLFVWFVGRRVGFDRRDVG